MVGLMASNPARPRGRQAQAAHNDELILQAAREVFLDDPEAPVSAVAAGAGVGIGALYHRYASKEDLLRTLCRNGQRVLRHCTTCLNGSSGCLRSTRPHI